MSITSDIPASFDAAFPAACKAIQCNSIDLLGVMMSESGLRADAWNDNPKDRPQDQRWNAVGLIQFMPAILPGCGWRNGYQAFRHLDATQQLPYVVSYFNSHPSGRPWTQARLYQATFLPATLSLGSDPMVEICVRGGRLGWAYSANAAFDANGDGRITVGELSDAITRNAKGDRWNEIVSRLGGTASTYADDSDLTTIYGVQCALVKLGADIAADGILGPKTREAIADFQGSHGLTPDGIVGPLTRAALKGDDAPTVSVSRGRRR